MESFFSLVGFVFIFLFHALRLYKWLVLAYSAFSLLLSVGIVKPDTRFAISLGRFLAETIEPGLQCIAFIAPRLVSRGLGPFLLWLTLSLGEKVVGLLIYASMA